MCLCSYVCSCPQEGETALHLAAQGGKVDVVRLLTEAQAQVNIQTEVYIPKVYLRSPEPGKSLYKLFIQVPHTFLMAYSSYGTYS